MLIHPRAGTFFFLALVLTDVELEPDAPLPDRCGTCTACLDACPTAAFPEPYVLDARRCISYLTIEQKGDIPDDLREGTGRHVFGCDICQDVCPWNRKAPPVDEPDFEPRAGLFHPRLAELAALTPDGFRERFTRSPVKRRKYEGFLMNVACARRQARGSDEG
jgi:epoxyqueuosine reductase